MKSLIRPLLPLAALATQVVPIALAQWQMFAAGPRIICRTFGLFCW